RFVGELTRLVYDTPAGRNAAGDLRLDRVRSLVQPASSPSDASQKDVVPIPLTTAIWSEAIFHRPLQPDAVFVAILKDRQASLLCHGLAALNDETLQFFAAHPGVLTRLYERASTPFGAFASHLRVRGGRVVPPGGAQA